MNKLSCDNEHIYRESTGHSFILVVTEEVANYLVTVHVYRDTSHEAGEALVNHLFCKHGPSSYLIFDEGQTFSSSVMQDFNKRNRYQNKDHNSI